MIHRTKITKEWSDNLTRMRLDKNMKQRDVAKACHISPSTYCRLEKHQNGAITDQQLFSLEEFFGVKLTPIAATDSTKELEEMVLKLQEENLILKSMLARKWFGENVLKSDEEIARDYFNHLHNKVLERRKEVSK